MTQEEADAAYLAELKERAQGARAQFEAAQDLPAKSQLLEADFDALATSANQAEERYAEAHQWHFDGAALVDLAYLGHEAEAGT